jgi:hypothetical protein
VLTQLTGVGLTGGGHAPAVPPEEELLDELLLEEELLDDELLDDELLEEELLDDELVDEPPLEEEPLDEVSPEEVPPHAASRVSTASAAAREYTRPRKALLKENFGLLIITTLNGHSPLHGGEKQKSRDPDVN